MGARVEVQSESGRDYQPEPTAVCDAEADGTFRIRLRGSDRLVSMHVRGVETIDEITLLKSVADVVQAAVNRTADAEREDEDQNLWPRAAAGEGDTIFRSPRMIELQKIAVRLAVVALPRPPHGRDGHRQGSVRPADPRGAARRSAARSCRSTARRCRASSSKASCSATAAAPSPARSRRFPASSAPPNAARCSSTKSATSIRRCSRSSCAFWRAARSIPSARRARSRSASASSPRPTPTSTSSSRRARFRQDLFYRIGGTTLAMPPLRERKDEIPALATLFLHRYARECHREGVRLGDDFVAALLLYDWPGNIRQLANEIRRVVALAADGDVLGPAHLAPEIARHLERAPDRPGRRRDARRRNPPRSAAHARARGARTTLHRARAGRVGRPCRRRRAAARPVAQRPVPQAPPLRPRRAGARSTENTSGCFRSPCWAPGYPKNIPDVLFVPGTALPSLRSRVARDPDRALGRVRRFREWYHRCTASTVSMAQRETPRLLLRPPEAARPRPLSRDPQRSRRARAPDAPGRTRTCRRLAHAGAPRRSLAPPRLRPLDRHRESTPGSSSAVSDCGIRKGGPASSSAG